MGARAFSQSGLGAGWRGAISIWMSSGAVAMVQVYCSASKSHNSPFAVRQNTQADIRRAPPFGGRDELAGPESLVGGGCQIPGALAKSEERTAKSVPTAYADTPLAD